MSLRINPIAAGAIIDEWFGPQRGWVWPTTTCALGISPIKTPRERIVENVGNVQKLTIHYKNGADYNVSNAMDVAVIKRAGGGFDISYVVAVDYKDDLGGITETGKGTLAYETHSGDVRAITARMVKVGDTRATEYMEFGGQ